MKRNSTTLKLFSALKLLRAYSLRQDKLFSLAQLDHVYPYLHQANNLIVGKVDRLANRILITKNFLSLVKKVRKNHGDAFTIKWLKGCHVALQKYIAGDPLKSLRLLEPTLPLPRLINGCPAFITKHDRLLIRSGKV
jgi:hypothetical protein